MQEISLSIDDVDQAAAVSPASVFGEHIDLRAMMELARREPTADNGLDGQPSYWLYPASVLLRSPSSTFSLQSIEGLASDSVPPFKRHKVFPISPDRPSDTGEFVGKSNGGFVVTTLFFNSKSPGPEPIVRFAPFGMANNRSGTMNEKHTKISIASLGDTTEAAFETTGVFSWGEAKETCKVASCRKAIYVANESNEGGSTQEPNAWDGAKLRDNEIVSAQGFELMFDVADACFELEDFVCRTGKGGMQGLWNARVELLDEHPHCWNNTSCPCGDSDTKLTENAANGVDARRAA